jgi:nitroimidazol reductase NimA-like FMN-containing flavoprotein (pyridoxamine 5'-phosphate oxidase superfamily)
MNSANDLRRLVKDLLSGQRFCVLATQGQGQPYGSLLAFAETENLKQLVFATSRDTRKFSNLKSDPRAALVIDSRSNSEADISSAVAVTALGLAREAAGSDRDHLAGVYLAKHPALTEFVGSADTAVCIVAVEQYIVARFREVTVLRP